MYYLKYSRTFWLSELTYVLISCHSSEKELTAFAETLLDIYRSNEKNDRQVIDFFFVYLLEILNLVIF